MSDSELIKQLEQRITVLENGKPVKVKAVREKSAYNIFVADHIAKAKKKDPDSKKKHTEYFSEAAKAWTSSKKK